MKRIAIIFSVLASLALIAFLIIGNQRVFGALQPSQSRTQSPEDASSTGVPTSPVAPGRTGQVASACRLVPNTYVDLSFNSPGLVAEVLVTEGQKVEKDQILAHLSNQEQSKSSVAAAELDLINAQQTLKTLYDEAPLQAAEALQALALAPEEVTQAEEKITGLQEGAFNQADVDAAEANLIFAENKLNQAQDAYRPYSNKNENNLVRAKLLTDLSQAQKEYEQALRKYNAFFGTPSESSISQAEADLALARVRQEEAQRKYEILKNGPDPDEVALAQARIANAEAQLAAAQASLANLELRAPFSGTIVTIGLKPGEYVSPGQKVMLLVDDSDWRIETTDLTELNIVRIREGDPTVITFDALPELSFQGSVVQVSSFGENRQGDITYKVLTNILGLDERLKWNMTCSAAIQTQ